MSLATVSRVVNGSGDVRPDLAERVHEAVKLLGYRRDLTASTLRRADRQSASIGLIIEDVSNPFFSAVHRGVEDVARPHGVLTFVGSSDERARARARARRGVRRARRRRARDRPCATDQSYLLREHQAGTALVFVDRPPRFMHGDAVVSDNAGGARAAVEHLIAPATAGSRFSATRLDVHRRRAPRAATTRRSPAPGSSARRARTAELAESDRRRARDARAAGVRRPADGARSPRRTSSRSARSSPCARLGRQREVALVGFDDVVLGDLVEPGVTVVAQDPYALGRHAGELLFARLRGDHTDARHVVVPTRLIERGSGEIPPFDRIPDPRVRYGRGA